MNIKWIGASSTNYQVGRNGKKIEFIVLHWIVGSLASADTTFNNPKRLASATFGIGENEIHQYVKEEDTSYANSNLDYNRRSITIEHEGGWKLPDGSLAKPTPEVHRKSIELVYEMCKKYNIPADRQHILKHKEVPTANTQCCGTLDIDFIVSEVKKKLDVIISPPMDYKAIFDLIGNKLRDRNLKDDTFIEPEYSYKDPTNGIEYVALTRDSVNYYMGEYRKFRDIVNNLSIPPITYTGTTAPQSGDNFTAVVNTPVEVKPDLISQKLPTTNFSWLTNLWNKLWN